MVITVNQNTQEVQQNISLSSLLSSMELKDKKGMAVALNFEVVQKSQWGDITLQEKDNVTIIQATQGG